MTGLGILLSVILLHGIPHVAAEEGGPGYDHGVAIGIDLGTTYMCVGALKNDKIEIIPNEHGRRVTPSYVAFTSEGERLIGDAAKAQVSSNPQNTIFNVKRLIGRTWNDPALQEDIKYLPYMVVNKNGKILVQVDVGGTPREFTPEEISAMLLAYMRQIAEAYLGQKVSSAVITVPAYFNNAQRQATKDAGKMAGLRILRIMNEPTAAVLASDVNRESKVNGRNILVYDLGGGTFDVSIVNGPSGIIDVLSTSGNTHLGGEDFDQRIINHFIKIIKKRTGHGINKNSKGLQKLRREAERAKRTLSLEKVAKIEVENIVEGEDLSEKLTRAEFEKMNGDLFLSTLVQIQKAMNDSGLENIHQIHEILFVGGSTRIPKIRELVQDYFWWQAIPIKGVDPIEAVAYGATAHACMVNHQVSIPDERIVYDIVPISLGVERARGVMSVLLKHGTVIPSRKQEIFTTADDYQTSVRVKVFEGEDSKTKNNNLLGTFELTGIEYAKAGKPEIKVVFEVDLYGILGVSAIDRSTGARKSITIKSDNTRLSNKEIEKKAGEINKLAERDAALHKQTDARDDFEHYIYDTRNRINEIGSELRDADRKFLNKALDEQMAWVDESNDAKISEFEHHKRILGAIVESKISKVHKRSDSDKGKSERQEL